MRKMYRLMCRRTRGSPPTGFGCTGEVCTKSQCEKRAMHNTEEASKSLMVEVPKKPKLNISQKELTSLLFATSSFNRQKMIIVTPRRVVHGDTNTPLAPSTFTRN